MQMSHIAFKFKALKLELFEDLLVHLVLISLPVQFNQFKVSYNCQKEKWTQNELISYCVQEKERHKHEKSESTHLVSTANDKGKKERMMKLLRVKIKRNLMKVKTVSFVRNLDTKKECTKYHAWHAKKGMFFTLICSEVNLASVPRNTG